MDMWHEKYIQGFGGNHEGRRPIERQRCRWENNTQTVLQEIGRKSVGWIDLALEGRSSGLW
jgi:hypothetical protein